MEICGNLMDNAYKYCDRKVEFKAYRDKEGLNLIFSNDGSSIEKEKLQKLMERGARADTLKSGQGIGLAVTAEVLKAYSGSINCSRYRDNFVKMELKIPN
jgi:two-component system sensor histidine kinase PhoQ